MRFGSVRLPDMLLPGDGIELAACDVGLMLEAQATRSIILNRAEDMILAGSIEPFRLPRKLRTG